MQGRKGKELSREERAILVETTVRQGCDRVVDRIEVDPAAIGGRDREVVPAQIKRMPEAIEVCYLSGIKWKVFCHPGA